jgi:ER lumen protein retaining receptor
MDIVIFVLSYLVQLVASCILLHRVQSVKSIYGLSLDSQICLLIATLSRCVWTVKTRIVETNVVLTSVAAFELMASLVSAVFLVRLFSNLRHTTTQACPTILSASVLVPFALTLAFLFNPGSWFNITAQVFVAFTMYLEAVALIPQLWLVRRMDDVEALTSHYVGILIIARAVRMMFWVVMFFDGQSFMCLFTADLLHTALSADYLYLWIRKLRHGGRLVYSL